MTDRSTLLARLTWWAKKIYRFLRMILFSCLLLIRRDQRRHILRWIPSMLPGYLLRKPSPWITFDAIEYLEKQQIQGRRIFEYGSGGSTFYWLSKGAECVSIEHDPHWHGRLKTSLLKRADYRLVPPSPPMSSEISGQIDDPGAYLSSDPSYPGYSFRSYVTQIDEFPAEGFDLVLIDGRSRPSCIRHAVPRIKRGGILIVDNTDRQTYWKALDELTGFRRLTFRGAVPQQVGWGQTDIFIKDS
ncbi:hypothetical protein QFZ82_001446 [Streptomyces sp. V4I23]|uniref:hypothetical protein n=1 Tax=Streptomyces sp. V4I23 TaxID=3042282 RepID=UPI00277DCD34|nr:hypothetical protein [Streptomyces sp. V4I23]MDQ1006961.1 hypothetical protein [Streptomyces sp. V4I23]